MALSGATTATVARAQGGANGGAKGGAKAASTVERKTTGTAPARVAPLAPGSGSIVGTVEDSLHDGALARAGVIVVQLPQHRAVTTDAGAFRIDSLPPGKYTLEVTHPVLDSLGIRLVSDTLPVTAGQVQTVTMGIPGPRRLTMAVCTPAKLRFGPGVILGRVIDADTEKPAEGAEVSIAWTETEVGTDVGVRSAPRVRKATVAADGTYRICGVPGSFKGTLQATHGAARTAEVPIEASEQALSMRMLYLPSASPQVAAAGTTSASAGASGATRATTGGSAAAGATGNSNGVRSLQAPLSGRAVIRGKVTNAGGVPVPDARVSVQGTSASTSTNADGSFTLTGVPAGTQAVLVRRVGYTPVELPMDVKSRTPNQMTVRLGTYTPQLATVEVKEKKTEALGSTGFETRRKTGMGKYLDEDQIANISPTFTTDALRRIPGLSVTGSGGMANVSTTRGNGCVRYLIDRNPVNTGGQSIDDLVNAQDVSAVEFYQPSETPLELSSGSNSGCALLVIWTKREVRDPRKH